jgi:hypothetical protein
MISNQRFYTNNGFYFGTKNLGGVIRNIYRKRKELDTLINNAYREGIRDIRQHARDIIFREAYDTGFMHDHLKIMWLQNGIGAEVGWKKEDFQTPKVRFKFYPPYVEYGNNGRSGVFALERSFKFGQAWMKLRISEAIKKGSL